METKFAVGRLVLSCAAVAMSGLLAAGAAQAESVTKVYQSRMHDGSLSFGDKPAQGAIETESRDYRLPDAPPAAVLEAERRNWAEQNRAFEQRYTDRLPSRPCRNASASWRRCCCAVRALQRPPRRWSTGAPPWSGVHRTSVPCRPWPSPEARSIAARPVP